MGRVEEVDELEPLLPGPGEDDRVIILMVVGPLEVVMECVS